MRRPWAVLPAATTTTLRRRCGLLRRGCELSSGWPNLLASGAGGSATTAEPVGVVCAPWAALEACWGDLASRRFPSQHEMNALLSCRPIVTCCQLPWSLLCLQAACLFRRMQHP